MIDWLAYLDEKRSGRMFERLSVCNSLLRVLHKNVKRLVVGEQGHQLRI